MWLAPFLPGNPSCGRSAPSCFQAFLAAGLVADALDVHREHAKSWGAGPRSGTSRARRRGEDGPKTVRWVGLAMGLPQPGVAMQTSPPEFCMLPLGTPCCMGRRCGRTEHGPCSGSCDADVLRASELEHAV